MKGTFAALSNEGLTFIEMRDKKTPNARPLSHNVRSRGWGGDLNRSAHDEQQVTSQPATNSYSAARLIFSPPFSMSLPAPSIVLHPTNVSREATRTESAMKRLKMVFLDMMSPKKVNIQNYNLEIRKKRG